MTKVDGSAKHNAQPDGERGSRLRRAAGLTLRVIFAQIVAFAIRKWLG